ncbi:3-dehydroquinate synthase [Psychrosphaera sp.]|nr:3-dehydroquinate synthase [Psychrosphaera sp.]
MKSLTVNLAEHSYPIYIEHDSSNFKSLFKSHIKSKQVVVVSNETVLPLFLTSISDALSDYDLRFFSLPDGEEHKTLASYESIMSFLLTEQLSRDVTLIALGGGVVGDITGFVAATFMRGVDFIQVPTTLLSQVDSSVGGKTAVNHPLGKNMIGAFYQPKAVLIDVSSLTSLPTREFSAGMAEVIKYGLLADADFFSYLESNKEKLLSQDSEILAYVISKCCQLKADIVSADEKEQGVRALLNLGHTFGHAIEAEQGYGNWLHGEAVAAGMVQAAKLSLIRGWVSTQDLERTISLLESFDLPVDGPTSMNLESYLKHMKKDKKVLAQTIRFILLKSLGQAILVSDVSEEELKQILV